MVWSGRRGRGRDDTVDLTAPEHRWWAAIDVEPDAAAGRGDAGPPEPGTAAEPATTPLAGRGIAAEPPTVPGPATSTAPEPDGPDRPDGPDGSGGTPPPDRPPRRQGAPPPPADRGADPDDPYAILRVPPNAEWDTIVAAYRRRARWYHPDGIVGGSEDDRRLADEMIRRLNAAYAELRIRRGR